MKQQTQSDEVEIYKNKKIILDTEHVFQAYESVEKIQELKKQAEFGIHYPHNEKIIDACDYMLDLRFL